jgi:hypothetical protein
MRKQRVTRAVYAVFTVFVGAFVVASTTQIARSLFGEGRGADDRARSPDVGEACSAALEVEIGAIDAARLQASTAGSGDLARARYLAARAGSGPNRADPPRACAAEPNGADALAALARYDRASEAHAFREASELSPVRHAAQSFIRGPR